MIVFIFYKNTENTFPFSFSFHFCPWVVGSIKIKISFFSLVFCSFTMIHLDTYLFFLYPIWGSQVLLVCSGKFCHFSHGILNIVFAPFLSFILFLNLQLNILDLFAISSITLSSIFSIYLSLFAICRKSVLTSFLAN